VAVVAEEETVGVDEGRLLQVGCDKVVVATAGAGNHAVGDDVGFARKAVYRVNVVETFALGERAPGSILC